MYPENFLLPEQKFVDAIFSVSQSAMRQLPDGISNGSGIFCSKLFFEGNRNTAKMMVSRSKQSMANTILIIDDEPKMITALSAVLQENDYNVIAVPSAIKGLEEVKDSIPDIIVVDWQMPDMSGIDFIHKIRQDSDCMDCYIIMISVRNETNDIVRGLDAGANDYLIKPYQIPELLARVRSGMRNPFPGKKIIGRSKKVNGIGNGSFRCRQNRQSDRRGEDVCGKHQERFYPQKTFPGYEKTWKSYTVCCWRRSI